MKKNYKFKKKRKKKARLACLKYIISAHDALANRHQAHVYAQSQQIGKRYIFSIRHNIILQIGFK